MRKTKAYCPDTSFLISLLDENDDNHEKAINEIKNIKVGELFIPTTVAQEFIKRSSQDIQRIIEDIIQAINKSVDSNVSLHQINVYVENAKNNFLKKYIRTDKNKLLNNVQKIRQYIKKIYTGQTGIDNKINKKNILPYLYLFKDNVNFEFINKFEVLRIIGSKSFHADPQAEDNLRKHLEYQKLNDLNDGIIINEILKYSMSNKNFYFYFLLFDKEFYRKASDYKTKLKCKNLEIKLIK